MVNLTEEQTILIDYIKKKQWFRVEEMWLELMGNPSEDLSFYELVEGTIARNGGAERLPDLWELLLNYFLEKQKHRLVIDLSRLVLAHCPDVPNLHPAVLQSVRELYKNCPRLETYIRDSHLKEKFYLEESLIKFEEFLFFDEGGIFQHISWGVGKVKGLDIPQNRVIIDFPQYKNKSFTFEGAHQYLTKLSPDHFLALQETKLEELKNRAANDPLEIVKIVLRSYNNLINLAELKILLCARVMTEDQFSSWWGKVKTSLRNDPWVELGTGNKPDICLRTEAKGYFEEMTERFEKGHLLQEKRKILKELLEHQKGQPLPMEEATPFVARVRQWHSALKKEALAERLNMIYLMEETAALMPTPPAPLPDSEDEILAQVQDPVSFLVAVGILDYQCKALERLILLKPEEAIAILQNLYFDGPPAMGRFAFDKLLEKEEYQKASDAVQKLLGHFDRNPEAYAWTVIQILKKKWSHITQPNSDFTLLVEALDHLEKTRQRYDATSTMAKFNRHVQSQLRAIYTGDKFSILAAVIDEISLMDARHLHNSLMTSPAFIGSVKEYIDNVFRRVRADIFQEEEEDNRPKVHYCTAEQLKIRQEALRRIKTIEIPRNTKDIERARGHGDLSENAEYDAAKNRQAMLFQQMENLQDLIVRARVISPENVQTAKVNIGTRFEARNLATGTMETYTLMGIWEAEPEINIVSYLSPLGQEFLGRKVGEILTVKTLSGVETQYEILSIRNAMMEPKKTV